jgi:hypothetical protein
LEGTTTDADIKLFVYEEGNTKKDREYTFNWTLHKEKGITFTTGGYGITFNRDEVSFKTILNGIQIHRSNCLIVSRVIQLLKY